MKISVVDISNSIQSLLNFTTALVFEVVTSGKFWSGIFFGAILFWVAHRCLLIKRYRVSQVSLNLPFNLGNLVYDATDRDRILAWKLYVQLKTRKAALIFDDAHDLIADVYDSLYGIFPVTRELLTNVPLHEAEKTDGVVNLILRVLNDGLRPHLTKWNATFRSWWEKARSLPENGSKSPQEIQCLYEKYDELIQELKQMNTELSKYAEDLMTIVKTKPGGGKRVVKKEPVAPERPLVAEVNKKTKQTVNSVNS